MIPYFERKSKQILYEKAAVVRNENLSVVIFFKLFYDRGYN